MVQRRLDPGAEHLRPRRDRQPDRHRPTRRRRQDHRSAVSPQTGRRLARGRSRPRAMAGRHAGLQYRRPGQRRLRVSGQADAGRRQQLSKPHGRHAHRRGRYHRQEYPAGRPVPDADGPRARSSHAEPVGRQIQSRRHADPAGRRAVRHRRSSHPPRQRQRYRRQANAGRHWPAVAVRSRLPGQTGPVDRQAQSGRHPGRARPGGTRPVRRRRHRARPARQGGHQLSGAGRQRPRRRRAPADAGRQRAGWLHRRRQPPGQGGNPARATDAPVPGLARPRAGQRRLRLLDQRPQQR
ncbi:hypothetical protein DUGA2_45350 [Duganella sp. HH101]|nr:hypothetical protein DUGA2_45350 [Duganella sp. HH101]